MQAPAISDVALDGRAWQNETSVMPSNAWMRIAPAKAGMRMVGGTHHLGVFELQFEFGAQPIVVVMPRH